MTELQKHEMYERWGKAITFALLAVLLAGVVTVFAFGYINNNIMMLLALLLGVQLVGISAGICTLIWVIRRFS